MLLPHPKKGYEKCCVLIVYMNNPDIKYRVSGYVCMCMHIRRVDCAGTRSCGTTINAGCTISVFYVRSSLYVPINAQFMSYPIKFRESPTQSVG